MSIEEREVASSVGTYRKRPIAIVRGDGPWVYDDKGNKYFDGIGGIGANVLGHNHEAFTAALSEQLRNTISVPELLCNDVRAEYQEKLLSMFPKEYNRVFLLNGGAEANEAALKFARLASGKEHLLSTVFGYHGKTLGALSVTHNPKYREPFEPLYPTVSYLSVSVNSTVENYQECVKEKGEVAAFIFEAIQGEGGVKDPNSELIATVAKEVQESGGYVIADEVQAGCGRTGTWSAFSRTGVTPDYIVLGKGIGNGVPLSAVVMHERVPAPPPLAHTTTYGGNPLSCRAGLAVLDIFEQEKVIENAATQGELFRAHLSEDLPSIVREIRGSGLMIGLELKQKAGPYLAKLQEEGLLALLAGPRVLRILPPLTMSAEDTRHVADLFLKVLKN